MTGALAPFSYLVFLDTFKYVSKSPSYNVPSQVFFIIYELASGSKTHLTLILHYNGLLVKHKAFNLQKEEQKWTLKLDV